MSYYEEPTNEFRQIKKTIHYITHSYSTEDGFEGYQEDVVVAIQRKYRIYEDDLIAFVEASPPKEEWRDISCVDDPKAP
jgi:hypothetical protein